MSWRTIHQMLGLAIIDPHFASRLLADPVLAAQEMGFDLSHEEQEALRNVRARDVAELGQILLEMLKSDQK